MIEFGIRRDWGFIGGHEMILAAGTDESVARRIGEALADATGAPHSIVYRRVGQEQWAEQRPEIEKVRHAHTNRPGDDVNRDILIKQHGATTFTQSIPAWIWCCNICGSLGTGLSSESAAQAESERHVCEQFGPPECGKPWQQPGIPGDEGLFDCVRPRGHDGDCAPTLN